MNNGGSRFNFDNLISLKEDDDGSASMDTSDSSDEQEQRVRNGSSHADAIAVDSDEDEHPRAKRARIGSPKLAAAAETVRYANDLVDMAWELDERRTFRGSLLDQHMHED